MRRRVHSRSALLRRLSEGRRVSLSVWTMGVSDNIHSDSVVAATFTTMQHFFVSDFLALSSTLEIRGMRWSSSSVDLGVPVLAVTTSVFFWSTFPRLHIEQLPFLVLFLS